MDMNKALKDFLLVIRDGYRNWKVYSARSTRKEYWLWTLYFYLHLYLVAWLTTPLGGFGAILMLLFFLAAIVPSISMAVRRIHDTGHRIWWSFIPLYGLLLTLAVTNELETRWARPGEPRPTKE